MIGIMADSHDNLEAIKEVICFFNRIKCDLIIHAGDFVAPFAAKELGKLSCPVKAVFGNCDGEKKGLTEIIQSFGEIKEAPFSFHYNQLKFLVTHLSPFFSEKSISKNYDIMVFGHTHRPEIRKAKETLLINPGEAGGWISGKVTVALLDEKSITAEIITL